MMSLDIVPVRIYSLASLDSPAREAVATGGFTTGGFTTGGFTTGGGEGAVGPPPHEKLARAITRIAAK